MKVLAIILFLNVQTILSQEDTATVVLSSSAVSITQFDPFRHGLCYAISRTYRLSGKLKQVVYDDWNGHRAMARYTIKGERKSYKLRYNPSWARDLHPPCVKLSEPL